MSDPAAKGGGGDAPQRPLGPDGKPIPGPAEVRQIQAARKMAQQQAQVIQCMLILYTYLVSCPRGLHDNLIINLKFS